MKQNINKNVDQRGMGASFGNKDKSQQNIKPGQPVAGKQPVSGGKQQGTYNPQAQHGGLNRNPGQQGGFQKKDDKSGLR